MRQLYIEDKNLQVLACVIFICSSFIEKKCFTLENTQEAYN